jgi:hypothetical protein
MYSLMCGVTPWLQDGKGLTAALAGVTDAGLHRIADVLIVSSGLLVTLTLLDRTLPRKIDRS